MCEKLWSCDECNIGMLQACNAATTKIPTQQASCDTDCDETGVKGTQMSCDSDCDSKCNDGCEGEFTQGCDSGCECIEKEKEKKHWWQSDWMVFVVPPLIILFFGVFCKFILPCLCKCWSRFIQEQEAGAAGREGFNEQSGGIDVVASIELPAQPVNRRR